MTGLDSRGETTTTEVGREGGKGPGFISEVTKGFRHAGTELTVIPLTCL